MYLLLILSCLLCSGCATIINGPDQKVTILSEPSGADIFINGQEAGKTPATFRMLRAKDHVITLHKQGHHVHTVELVRALSGVSVFYLLPGGLISAALDSADGSIYCFDDEVNVQLKELFDPSTVLTEHIDLLKSLSGSV